MSAASAAMFEERIDAGRLSSFLLAATVHLLLFAVLVFGVQWQNRPPEAIQVELWTEPVAEPKPVPQAEPAPAPVVKAEPVTPKPDIAEKAPPPKPLPKVEPKPAPLSKPVAKAEPAKPRPEDARRMQQELAREQASFAVAREKQQIQAQLEHEAASARNKAIADWVGKVRAKIRSNIVLPPDLQGNPEAVFKVTLLPNGEVLDSKSVKSSGHRGYDEAIERAILKSSPLPKPDRAEIFDRELRLTFHPKD